MTESVDYISKSHKDIVLLYYKCMPPKGIKKQKKMQKSEVSEESSDDEKH